MPNMTMRQAAAWAGVTRGTIHKSIQSGRLSARKDGSGVYQIDPAELERVYRPAASSVASGVSADTLPGHADTAKETAKNREIALLREMLGKADAAVSDLRAERDRLLGMVEAANLTVRQLTHDRPGVPEAGSALPVSSSSLMPQVRAWLRLRLGRK